MKTKIRGLNSDSSTAPPAPEMGARLPVPGLLRELHSGEPRWICMYCTAEGPGRMPERLHAEARCLGWRRWPYLLGDWLKRWAARPVRQRIERERWEREHPPKSDPRLIYEDIQLPPEPVNVNGRWPTAEQMDVLLPAMHKEKP